ncbi:MAG: DNA adenine methylase [Rhodospirillales bacterium]|nr:DNA adenine methylase [Rhodospirillales bacterium]
MKSIHETREVRPLPTLAPYQGGKRNLAKTIIERIEAVPHTTYAEGFVGMAGVFLRRRQAVKSEVINDINKDVATFFRVLQRHYIPFLEMMRFQITTRAEFERLAATEPGTLTDLERAARFLYLQRTAFGGKVTGQAFGVALDRPGRFDITKLGSMLEDVHERLSGVVIECLPWAAFLDRYDRPQTLFYLDPPYMGTENVYGKGVFGRDDFSNLADRMSRLKGRVIMSINDVPEIRKIFKDFILEKVKTTYTIGGGKNARPAGELLITNQPTAKKAGGRTTK